MPPPQSPSGPTFGPTSPAKVAVRDRLVTQRNRRSLADVVAAGSAIAGHLLAAPEVRRAATVAAYVSVGREPGTHEVIEAIRGSGRHVIVPRLLAQD